MPEYNDTPTGDEVEPAEITDAPIVINPEPAVEVKPLKGHYNQDTGEFT